MTISKNSTKKNSWLLSIGLDFFLLPKTRSTIFKGKTAGGDEERKMLGL